MLTRHMYCNLKQVALDINFSLQYVFKLTLKKNNYLSTAQFVVLQTSFAIQVLNKYVVYCFYLTVSQTDTLYNSFVLQTVLLLQFHIDYFQISYHRLFIDFCFNSLSPECSLPALHQENRRYRTSPSLSYFLFFSHRVPGIFL